MIRDAMRIRLVTAKNGSAWSLEHGPRDLFQRVVAKLHSYRKEPDEAAIVMPFG